MDVAPAHGPLGSPVAKGLGDCRDGSRDGEVDAALQVLSELFVAGLTAEETAYRAKLIHE